MLDAVKFLYLGMKPLITVSVGQNTVKPASMFSLNVASAPEAFSKSEKALQPCFDIICVRLSWLGSAVGASASAEFRTWIKIKHQLTSIQELTSRNIFAF